MTDTRKDIVLNEDEVSLLDVMLKNQDTIKISLPASQSASDAIEVMSKLSLTCHTFHSLFKQQLDQQAAKKLCQHVVYGEKKEAEEILARHPRLLLMKSLVTDEADRKIDGTAFQIALGAKDVSPFPKQFNEMAEMIAGYFEKIHDGEKERQKQYVEQFPEGFEKRETARRVQDLKALKTVFVAIKNATTMAEARAAVTAFQAYLKQQTAGVIKTGYHFNEALFVQALKIYDDMYDAFDGFDSDKNKLAAIEVVGGIQRYFTANLAQAACDGFGKAVEEKKTLSRSKVLTHDGTSFFSSKLGVDHFVYSYYAQTREIAVMWGLRKVRGGGSRRSEVGGAVSHCAFFKTYVKRKRKSWKTYATTLSAEKAMVCDFLMNK